MRTQRRRGRATRLGLGSQTPSVVQSYLPLLLRGDEIPFFERTDLPASHEAEPILSAGTLVDAGPEIPALMAPSLIEELM